MMRVAEELTAKGFTVEAEHQTGNVLTRQAAACLKLFGMAHLNCTMIRSWSKTCSARRSSNAAMGTRSSWRKTRMGMGTGSRRLLNILPFMLEALGQPAPAPFFERFAGTVGGNWRC